MNSALRILRALLATSFLFALGCTRTPFADRPISAATPDDFAEWRTRLGAEATEDQWRDFDVAVQELKIKVMAERGNSAKDVLDEGMRGKINGKTLREALVLGFEARRERLERERAEVQARIDHDSRLVTKPDTASSAYVASVKRADSDRRDLLTREVAEVNEKLAGWGVAPANVAQAPAKTGPAAAGTPVASQDTH